jgi:hypothetical protein
MITESYPAQDVQAPEGTGQAARRPPQAPEEGPPPEAVQRENQEFSDQAVGRNVDVEA